MKWHVQVHLPEGRPLPFALSVEIQGSEEPIALIGANGSGKTTLLRTIAGALTPEQGRIQLGTQVVLDTEKGICLPPEQRQIGYVPQGYGLFPHLSVLDNVAFGLLARTPRLSLAQRHKQAMDFLEEMGCLHLASRQPQTLSGGEKQRVALARTLLAAPQLLLLDEPLSALDIPARRILRTSLAQLLSSRKRPVLIATHDVRDVVGLCTRVCVLEHGKIVQSGSIQEVRQNPNTDFVAEFFHREEPM